VHSADADPRNPIHVISIHYSATIYESLSVPELLNFPDVYPIGRTGPLMQMAKQACSLYQHQPAGYRAAFDALMTQFLLMLIWNHGGWLDEQGPNLEFADLQRLQPALRMMHQDLADSPAMGSLAREAGLSEPQFRRVFRRGLGMSPVAYLRRIRIEEACRLLRQTSNTVEAITARVGYAEPSFFARTFKAFTGMTPGQYRTVEKV
jgi:AraC-like DNA-binding protein